jgi:hypothetical protein
MPEWKFFERIKKNQGGVIGQYVKFIHRYLAFPKLGSEIAPHTKFRGQGGFDLGTTESLGVYSKMSHCLPEGQDFHNRMSTTCGYENPAFDYVELKFQANLTALLHENYCSYEWKNRHFGMHPSPVTSVYMYGDEMCAGNLLADLCKNPALRAGNATFWSTPLKEAKN